MPDLGRPARSSCVLDGAAGQLDLPASAAGLSATTGSGPAPAPTTIRATCTSWRPSPASGCGRTVQRILRAERARGRGIELAWTRRTRIDGDSWLGDGRAARRGAGGYLLRVRRGRRLLREVSREPTSYLYSRRRAGARRRPAAAGVRGCPGLGPVRAGTLSRGSNSMAKTAQLDLPLVDAGAGAEARDGERGAGPPGCGGAAAGRLVAVMRSPPAAADGRRELPGSGGRDWRLERQGRPDRGLEQRRLDLSGPAGGLAGLGREPGRRT